MTQAQNIIQSLRLLASLEIEERKSSKHDAQHQEVLQRIETLRALLPTAILGHHDRLKARGKPSVAPVRHGVCGACHLAIPHGRLADLRRTADALNVCDHCGVFVYLVDEGQPTITEEPVVAKKTKRLPRKPRTAVKNRRQMALAHS